MTDTRKSPDSDPENKKRKKSISMHDDVPVWYDCCSCEAEPYWEEMMQKPNTEEKGKRTKPSGG